MATNNPSKGEVAAPTVRKDRDAAIHREMQYYGIFEAFGNGKLPSNQQIDIAMNSALESDMLSHPSKELSREGRELVGDLRDVIKNAQTLLLSKNHRESLQKFIYYCSTADPSAATPNAPISSDKAKNDGDRALQSLKTLGTLVVTNGQFRKLISDAGLLLRDMAGDAAEKATSQLSQVTEKIRPDEEKINQIDEPAPDNEWHEKPDTAGFKQQAKDGLNQVKSKAQTAKNEASNAHEDYKNSSSTEEAKNKIANRADRNVADEDQQRAKDKAQEVKDTAVEKKEQTKQQTKDYLKDKVPEERRNKAIDRLKKMVVEIQDHEDYNDAIDSLLHMAEQYKGHTKTLTKQTASTVQQGHESSSNLQKAETELKILLEYFANSTSMDDMIDAVNDIYDDAEKDPKLKQWFREVDTYIRRVLKETGYILSDDADKKYNDLEKRGREYANGRYKSHFDRLSDEFTRFFDEMSRDPQNVKFGNSVQKLLDDLGTDSNGNMKFKKHLLKDVTNVLIPSALKKINYVPIPRIEVSDPKVDLIVENLILQGQNIMPNVIEVENHNFVKYSAYKRIDNASDHMLRLKLSQIQLDLKDIAYYFKQKDGFPHIKDQGLMDIKISGRGLSANVGLETSPDSDTKHAFFKPAVVKVEIHSMDIKLTKSNHKLLYSIFRPLLMSIMKPAIAKAAEVQIRKSLQDADSYLYSLYKEVQKEKRRVENKPADEKVGELKMYTNMIQRRFNESKEQKKRRAEEVANRAKQTKVNVAATREGTIFKDVKLEGGVTSNIATDMKRRAREGEDWHSPMFSIGSARESSHIPKPKEIRRKSPNERATINGGDHPNANATGSHAGSSGVGNVASIDSTNANRSSPYEYTSASATRGANSADPSLRQNQDLYAVPASQQQHTSSHATGSNTTTSAYEQGYQTSLNADTGAAYSAGPELAPPLLRPN